MEAALRAPPPRVTPPAEADLYAPLLRTLNDMGDGLVLLEGERIVWANEAFARMTGYLAGELTGPEFSLRYLFPPEEQERMDERLRKRLSGDVPEEHYEVRILRLTGERREVEVSVKPLSMPERSLRFALVRDVTSRKRAMEELEIARKERAQSEKMAALGSLVSGVAHEIRTPLAFIANNAHLIQRRMDKAPLDDAGVADVRTCLASVQEGIDRINRLVKDLHRYTKLPEAEARPCFLEDVVRDAIELWRATHPGAGVQVVEQLDPTSLLRLDAAKVQQIVLNLLENGAEAMPVGGVVRISTEALPDAARLIVRDEGVGMPPSVLGRIFEPLYTTKPEGMGLGLAIVRRIVELHRGTIRCDSSPGSGTTFTITFPQAY